MSLLKKVLYYVTILVEGVGVDVPGGGDGDGQQVAGGNGQQDGVCRGPHLGSERRRMNQLELSQPSETRDVVTQGVNIYSKGGIKAAAAIPNRILPSVCTLYVNSLQPARAASCMSVGAPVSCMPGTAS